MPTSPEPHAALFTDNSTVVPHVRVPPLGSPRVRQEALFADSSRVCFPVPRLRAKQCL